MRNESSAAIRQQAVFFYFKSRHSMLRSQSMAFGRTRWIGAREVVPKEVLEEECPVGKCASATSYSGF